MIIETLIKDLKEAGEELAAGSMTYLQIQTLSLTGEAIKFTLNVMAPLIVAYIVHKLKTNYWAPKRSFMKNIVSDLVKAFKNKK